MVDAAGAAGRLVGMPLALLAWLRNGKPMHPRGVVVDAVLDRQGSDPPWGVPWLDDRVSGPALVRLSRSVGLPSPLPDLQGLAVRAPGDWRPVDLLLTSAGPGPLGRFLPMPRRHAAVPYSSIMGYRSDAGTLRFAAFPLGRSVSPDGEETADRAGTGLVLGLAAARGVGPWRPFARLTLAGPRTPRDPDLRFDAVQNSPPGLVADGPMARFRAPAYARARRARISRRR